MIWNFKYFIVFTSASGVLPEQNDWYGIQPWKVNEIKALLVFSQNKMIDMEFNLEKWMK